MKNHLYSICLSLLTLLAITGCNDWIEGNSKSNLQLSTTTLSLATGQQGTVDIVSGSGSYKAVSNAESVATVTVEGSRLVITGVSPGAATITVKDNQTQERAKIEVTVSETPEDNAPEGVEAVDLGLPSGTLWANMNVGASSPEDYGDYFAWGEVTPRNQYYWDSYKWCNGSWDSMTKYCTDSSYGNDGFTDNKTVLDAEDDAAHVNWGGDWRMPTEAECQELIDNTTSERTTQNGVNGRKFTSKTNGKSIFLPAAGYRRNGELNNAGSLGNYWSSTLYESIPYDARYLRFDSGRVYTSDNLRFDGRSVRPVRQGSSLSVSAEALTLQVGESATVDVSGSGSYKAVSNAESVATVTVEGSRLVITGVSPGAATITVKDNQTQERAKVEVTVSNGGSTITVTPEEINFGQVHVGTSRTEHLTVSNVGASDLTFHLSEQHDEIDIPESGIEFTLASGEEKVFDVVYTPIKANSGSGAAVRVFSDAENGTQYVNISGQGVEGGTPEDNAPEGVEAVDLGLPSGTRWANMNVGAESPEDYGDYFAWGEVTPQSDNAYSWESYKWCNGSWDSMTKYCTDSDYGNDGFVDNKTVLDAEDDAAHVNWGGDWRMPTHAECEELRANTTSEWTSVNGVNGRKFTSKTNGKSIFLPAAGLRWTGGLYDAGSYGYFWSSTLYESSPYGARYLNFGSGYVYADDFSRKNGQSVRPVRQN